MPHTKKRPRKLYQLPRVTSSERAEEKREFIQWLFLIERLCFEPRPNVTACTRTQSSVYRICGGRCSRALRQHVEHPGEPAAFGQRRRREEPYIIVIKDPTITKARKGRRRERERHGHRRCHTASIEVKRDLKIAAINMQGWNWSKLDPVHLDKSVELADFMRKHELDIVALSELHGATVVHCVDRAGGNEQRNVANTIVAFDEFVLVSGDKVGFAMSQAMAKLWRASGAKVDRYVERIMRLEFDLGNVKYDFVAVYAPTGDPEGRLHFLEQAEEMRSTRCRTGAEQLWAGDWNSHIGRDSSSGTPWRTRPGDGPAVGPFASTTPTTPSGKQLKSWLDDGAVGLYLLDSFRHVQSRCTWRHNRAGFENVWYELDFFVGTAGIGKSVQNVTTEVLGCTDHVAKICRLRLRRRARAAVAVATVASRAEQRQLQKPLRTGSFRGPSAQAVRQRSAYEDLTNELAEEAECTWQSIAGVCVKAVEDTVGRGSCNIGGLYLDGKGSAVKQERDNLKAMHNKMRHMQGKPEEAALKEQYAVERKKFRGKRRQIRREWIEGILKELDHAMAIGDLGKFYMGLRELGVSIEEFSQRGRVEHTPEQLKQHFEAIGKEQIVVTAEVLSRLPRARPTRDSLGEAPGDAEILVVWKKMRESAAGPDEVTINMLRYAGDKLQAKFFDLVRKYWENPSDWEMTAHAAKVIALFKKGDRHRLDNYRGISLLSIISRVVARVIAVRLRDYAEEVGVFRVDQWGFRPWRSTRDAILLARLLLEAATRVKHREGLDHLVLSLLDIQKAYPRTPRNGAWAVLLNEGVPNKMVDILAHIHGDTRYKCVNGLGESAEYLLHCGLREGCPSSCVIYLMYHNAVLRDYMDNIEPNSGVVIRTSPDMELGGIQTNNFERIYNEWEAVVVNLACFADDTTQINRESKVRSNRQAITRVLRDWKETVHPGKWQHLRARHSLSSGRERRASRRRRMDRRTWTTWTCC